MQDTVDSRRLALEHWLAGPLRLSGTTLTPASADASFRRYFRVHLADGGTRIAMDAPPAQEHCGPFVRVAGLLREAGVHAPQVLEMDLDQGFLLLTDLGNTTFLAALNESNADALFADAVGALLKWQQASRPGVLPAYDRALLRRELDLFPEWYLGRHLGFVPDAAARAVLESLFTQLIDSALAQPVVFVHRDYMPRNLMVCEPNPGVLDFQDAVLGPISYDVISLMRDAFLSWEEARVLDVCVRYWERARAAGLPVDADFAEFFRAAEWMGMQRHLKVLGIFARLAYRDDKPAYLADTPRFLGYVRAVAKRYAALAPVLRVLERAGADGAPA